MEQRDTVAFPPRGLDRNPIRTDADFKWATDFLTILSAYILKDHTEHPFESETQLPNRTIVELMLGNQLLLVLILAAQQEIDIGAILYERVQAHKMDSARN